MISSCDVTPQTQIQKAKETEGGRRKENAMGTEETSTNKIKTTTAAGVTLKRMREESRENRKKKNQDWCPWLFLLPASTQPPNSHLLQSSLLSDG
jgi:hypothetical protein